jgi:predicted DNA-binding transcriptional regulator AlpA
MSLATERRWVPDPQVCKRYGISAMTLWRWDRNSELAFPKPMVVNRRKYRDEAELDAFDARHHAKAKEVA